MKFRDFILLKTFNLDPMRCWLKCALVTYPKCHLYCTLSVCFSRNAFLFKIYMCRNSILAWNIWKPCSQSVYMRLRWTANGVISHRGENEQEEKLEEGHDLYNFIQKLISALYPEHQPKNLSDRGRKTDQRKI